MLEDECTDNEIQVKLSNLDTFIILDLILIMI